MWLVFGDWEDQGSVFSWWEQWWLVGGNKRDEWLVIGNSGDKSLGKIVIEMFSLIRPCKMVVSQVNLLFQPV